MKIIVVGVRNLDSFIEFLRSRGFMVEESTSMVLTDNSEIGEWEVRDSSGKVVGRFMAHFIRHYYAALKELPSNASDREVLERLLKAKYFDEKWSSPVEPLVVLGDEELAGVLRDYSDDYPNDRARLLVEQYFASGGVRVMTKLARRLLENLVGGDEGPINRDVKKDQPSEP